MQVRALEYRLLDKDCETKELHRMVQALGAKAEELQDADLEREEDMLRMQDELQECMRERERGGGGGGGDGGEDRITIQRLELALRQAEDRLETALAAGDGAEEREDGQLVEREAAERRLRRAEHEHALQREELLALVQVSGWRVTRVHLVALVRAGPLVLSRPRPRPRPGPRPRETHAQQQSTAFAHRSRSACAFVFLCVRLCC